MLRIKSGGCYEVEIQYTTVAYIGDGNIYGTLRQ